MNRKGQGFGFIRVLFYGVFFLLLFSLALAPFVAGSIGGLDLTDWGGLGAWFIGSMNIWFLGFALIGILGALVWGFASE